MCALAGLKHIMEVIKTVIYIGSDSENKFPKTLWFKPQHKNVFFSSLSNTIVYTNI